jgi:endonuclease/exonuclease/phosphatase family metal-dependent hydrolase
MPKLWRAKPRRAQFKNYDDPLGPRFEGHFARGQPTSGVTLKPVTHSICQGQDVGQAIEGFRALGHLQATDHVFARGFQVLGAGAVYTARANDHLPVWAGLGWSDDVP